MCMFTTTNTLVGSLQKDLTFFYKLNRDTCAVPANLLSMKLQNPTFYSGILNLVPSQNSIINI